MSNVVQSIYSTYYDYYYVYKDPRADGVFLFESPPISMAILLLAYVILIKVGPKLMRTKQPVNLKKILIVYNAAQVVMNTVYITMYAMEMSKMNKPLWGCFGHEIKDRVIWKYIYIYLIIKFIDFFDTLFIVLRKSDRQLTLLHCYHHISIALFSYYLAMWNFDSIFLIGTFINSFIHALMYSYYLMSTLSKRFRQFRWIKTLMTKMQIFQFMIGIVIIEYFHWTDPKCQLPKGLKYFVSLYLIIFIYLFVDFYRTAYAKDKKIKKQQ